MQRNQCRSQWLHNVLVAWRNRWHSQRFPKVANLTGCSSHKVEVGGHERFSVLWLCSYLSRTEVLLRTYRLPVRLRTTIHLPKQYELLTPISLTEGQLFWRHCYPDGIPWWGHPSPPRSLKNPYQDAWTSTSDSITNSAPQERTYKSSTPTCLMPTWPRDRILWDTLRPSCSFLGLNWVLVSGEVIGMTLLIRLVVWPDRHTVNAGFISSFPSLNEELWTRHTLSWREHTLRSSQGKYPGSANRPFSLQAALMVEGGKRW